MTALGTKASLGFALVLLLMPFSGAYAQTEGGREIEKAQAEHTIIEEVADSNKEAQQVKKLTAEETNKYIDSLAQGLKKTMISIQASNRLKEKSEFPYAGVLKDLINIRAKNSGIEEQVYHKLNRMMREIYSAYKDVENIGSMEKTYNAVREGNVAAIDEYYYKEYNKLFCIQGSATGTEDCKNGSNVDQYPNFHDFFLAEKTWPDSKVLDVMSMARRFFSGMDMRMSFTDGLDDVATMMETQGKLARASLRMSVLNDLASRRASISYDTSMAMDVILSIYTSSGQIRSTDLNKLCVLKDLSAAEGYVCDMTSKSIDDKGTRLISQVVVDRALQHDIYMSPDYYAALNQPDVYVSGVLDKQEVFTKAQQVAQAYRELQLLQMKTALFAMNMMNR